MFALDLLLSFDGRIRRRHWWIGFVVVVLASIGIGFAVDPAYVMSDSPRPPNIWYTLSNLLLSVPGTAITVKRFNDRDWPYWLGYLFGLSGIAITVLTHLGWFLDPTHLSVGEWTVLGSFLAIGLFAFIDNGFLKGTPGPNRYGPSPVPEVAAPAAPSDAPAA
jgi:uncharacterized membrane protein YhaH (DUF805 family)